MKRIGSYRALFSDLRQEERDQLVSELAGRKSVNAVFLLLIAVLTTFGLMILYSSGIIQSYLDSSTGDLQGLIARQTILSAVGIILSLIISFFINVDKLNKFTLAVIAYALTTGFLFAVPFLGRTINGARRWITVGGIDFQPSELAKFSTVFVLACYFSHLKRRLPLYKLRGANSQLYHRYTTWYIVFPGLAIGLWILLVVIQPHLSGAILLTLISLVVFLAVGIPGKLWLRGILRILPLILVLIILASAYFAIFKQRSLGDFIEDHFVHVKTRTEIFTSEDDKQTDTNYQVVQSRIALGAGGWTGVGLGNSRQKYNYLPAIHNDYIFSGIGEELGFVGCSSLIILFMLLFFAGIYISGHSASLFASLLAWGFTFLLTIQALLNMAVAVEVIPATGISLPFFSYGGTANIVFLVEAGMILAVSRSSKKQSDIVEKTLEKF